MALMKTPSFILHFSSSQWLLSYLILLYVTVLLALYYLSLNFIFTIVLLVLITVFFRRAYQCHIGHGSLIYRDECWTIISVRQRYRVTLCGAIIWPWLIVMNFRQQEGMRHYHLILWPDSADSQRLRQLRIMLRHFSVYDI